MRKLNNNNSLLLKHNDVYLFYSFFLQIWQNKQESCWPCPPEVFSNCQNRSRRIKFFYFLNKRVFYFNDALKFLFSQKEILLTVEENSNPDDNILDKSVLLWSKWDFAMFSLIFSFHISEEWKIVSNESLILFFPTCYIITLTKKHIHKCISSFSYLPKE